MNRKKTFPAPKAAAFTQDRSIQTACYFTAGTLLKNIAPKVANADFKKLAEIAPELIENNWFKPLREVGVELNDFYGKNQFFYSIGGIRNLKPPMPVVPEVKLPEYDGKTETLVTLADIEFRKMQCGEDSWSGPQVTTAIFEGVKIKDFLADIGCPNATGLTVYHSDSEWYKEPFEYSAELIQEDGSLIAWIQNKTEIVKNSTTFVALVCENGGVNDMCSSIAKIVVHQ